MYRMMLQVLLLRKRLPRFATLWRSLELSLSTKMEAVLGHAWVRQREPRLVPRLSLGVEPDRDGAPIVRPSIAEQFAAVVGHVGCARRGALDPTTQDLQFGHQVYQCPGGKNYVRLLGWRVTQHHRGGASS